MYHTSPTKTFFGLGQIIPNENISDSNNFQNASPLFARVLSLAGPLTPVKKLAPGLAKSPERVFESSCISHLLPGLFIHTIVFLCYSLI